MHLITIRVCRPSSSFAVIVNFVLGEKKKINNIKRREFTSARTVVYPYCGRAASSRFLRFAREIRLGYRAVPEGGVSSCPPVVLFFQIRTLVRCFFFFFQYLNTISPVALFQKKFQVGYRYQAPDSIFAYKTTESCKNKRYIFRSSRVFVPRQLHYNWLRRTNRRRETKNSVNETNFSKQNSTSDKSTTWHEYSQKVYRESFCLECTLFTEAKPGYYRRTVFLRILLFVDSQMFSSCMVVTRNETENTIFKQPFIGTHMCEEYQLATPFAKC